MTRLALNKGEVQRSGCIWERRDLCFPWLLVELSWPCPTRGKLHKDHEVFSLLVLWEK